MDRRSSRTGSEHAGQVCDRCRLKKIKCDGDSPSCGHCLATGSSCIVSARLRRKTKIRGFRQAPEHHMSELQEEVNQLTQSLQLEREAAASLQHRVNELTLALEAQAAHLRSLQRDSAGRRTPPRTAHTQQSQKAKEKDGTGPIMKHMGRLVQDADGNERFAGSTTGVHFILTAQQAMLKYNTATGRFPENCYRLHFLSLSRDGFAADRTLEYDNSASILGGSLDFYQNQVRLFNETWAGLCPIICESDFTSHLGHVIERTQQQHEAPVSGYDACIVFQATCITLINMVARTDEHVSLQNLGPLTKHLHKNVFDLAVLSDLAAVQGLILFSLFIQITGQVRSMPQFNGLLVRAAHSLGLHRHTRRFKFNAGQVELRKRLWWCIYTFDKISSITLGHPQLIQNADVDVDYPIDCDLRKSNVTQLTFPLPGESTMVKEFIALCHLAHILAGVLDQLYTTTHRRRGGENMAKIHHDLETWKQTFSNLSESADRGSTLGQSWLPAIAYLATMLIYLPGLTFEATTPQFQQSLSQCLQACTALVNLACSETGKASILGVIPLNPSLLFQCALMHLYYHSLPSTERGTTTSKDVGIEASAGIVECVAFVLADYQPAYVASWDGDVEQFSDFRRALTEASDLLFTLNRAVFGQETVSLGDFRPERELEADLGQYVSSSGLIQSTLEVQSQNPTEQIPVVGDMFENISASDGTDWVFDSLLDPFPQV